MEARGDRTLIDVLHDLEDRDFRAQFVTRSGGQLECGSCQQRFDASELAVDSSERLEGASDPADMMMVVGGACPHCGAKGTLVVTYGPMAGDDDADVEGRLSLG